MTIHLHIDRWGIPFEVECDITYNPAPDEPVEFDSFIVKINGHDVSNLIDQHCFQTLYETAIDQLPDSSWADFQPDYEEELA